MWLCGLPPSFVLGLPVVVAAFVRHARPFLGFALAEPGKSLELYQGGTTQTFLRVPVQAERVA